MKAKNRLAVSCASLLFVLNGAATSAAAEDRPIDSLAARHESVLATPEGAAYQHVVGRTVAENFSSMRNHCGATSTNATFLFEISTEGVVGASGCVPSKRGEHLLLKAN